MFGMVFLILTSIFVLRSIVPSLFPAYFIYIGLAIIVFFVFQNIDFEILQIFAKQFYVISIILLILPLIIGQVSRGAIRWIPLGPITIQPSEVVRPFLLLYFANYLTEKEVDLKRVLKAFGLLFLPFILILIQPSLGVAVLTTTGFIGVLLATTIKKKILLFGALSALLASPVVWFLLAPYQKSRIQSFIDPSSDPFGSGYNSVQSMISVGSGELFGRGLGKGVQTQLAFLPEKHTDFIFAATAEELGLVGAGLLLIGIFAVLWGLIQISENSINPTARSFVSGVFLVVLIETVIHVGMNMGLLPITGVPFPLVSAGGSALLGSITSLSIAINARKS